MTEMQWNTVGISDRKLGLIKIWFERRFGRKAEYDASYFKEWLGRFAFLKDNELPWQMDRESRQTWRRVAYSVWETDEVKRYQEKY